MAKIRNVSPHGLELRYAGRSLGTAEPDGVLDIPDDIATNLVFPESLWAVVTPPAKKTSAKESN